MLPNDEQAIEADRVELRKLIESRDDLTRRISMIANKLDGVAVAIEDPRFRAEVLRDVYSARKKPKTMEDAVLRVMREHRDWLLPPPKFEENCEKAGLISQSTPGDSHIFQLLLAGWSVSRISQKENAGTEGLITDGLTLEIRRTDKVSNLIAQLSPIVFPRLGRSRVCVY